MGREPLSNVYEPYDAIMMTSGGQTVTGFDHLCDSISTEVRICFLCQQRHLSWHKPRDFAIECKRNLKPIYLDLNTNVGEMNSVC